MAKSAVKEYLAGSPIHGLPDLGAARNHFMRGCWAFVLIAATVYCSFEIGKTMDQYLHGHPITTASAMTLEKLPNLTVCQKYMGPTDDAKAELQSTCGDLGDMTWYNWLTMVNVDGMSESDDLEVSVLEFCGGLDEDPNIGTADLAALLHKYSVPAHPDLELEHFEAFSAYKNDKCLQELYSKEANKFRKLLKDLSLVETLEVVTQIKKDASGSNTTGPEVSNEIGVCSTFSNWESKRISETYFSVRHGVKADNDDGVDDAAEVPGVTDTGFKIEMDGVPIMNYETFKNRSRAIQVLVSLTKIKRMGNCMPSSVKEMKQVTNECRNQLLFKNANCCNCGSPSATKCPAGTLCCTLAHFCEVASFTPGFNSSWEQCNVNPKKKAPCQETKYTSFVVSATEDLGEPALNIHVKIINMDAVFTLEERPPLSANAVLGNVGGVVGLFLGGSIMSIVQMILFCMDKAMQRKGNADPRVSDKGAG